ncbi:EAL domain-containing protein [Desulfocurvus sp.]|uniref:EAL domain-containing protein n=1 Tax=Desulfocurvus sp. TaxID=2871698 RepID=UPI0025C6CFBD|nr:EAL domain-containing protein [Desulfocurvus sp.]
MKLSRLFKRTLVFMILAFGLLAGATSLYSSYTLRERLTREFESKGLAIAGSIASSSVDLLLSDDAAAIQSVMDQYPGIEGVRYALVASARGEALAHTFVPQVPEAVVAALWDMRMRGGGRLRAPEIHDFDIPGLGPVIHVSYPVLAGEAGSVHIGMDRRIIDTAIRNAIINLQVLTFGVFLLCVVAAYSYTDSISRPLTALAAYARRVRGHDFSDPPDIPARGDEVAEVAEAFRTTAQELAGFIAELERRMGDATAESRDALATVSAILRNMADGLFLAGSHGRVIQANPALGAMLGRPADSLTGLPVATLLGADPARPLLDGTARGERSTAELTVPRVGDAPFPAEISLAALDLGGTRHVVGILRDVTARRQAEQALRDARDALEERVRERTEDLWRANDKLSAEIAERRTAEAALRQAEAKFRGLFENSMEGIFRLDAQGRYVEANPALARIFGHPEPGAFLAALAEDPDATAADPEKEAEFLARLLAGDEVRGFESRARRRDGHEIWISRNARPVRDHTGTPIGHEGFLQDITERKEAESRLMHQAFHDPLTGLPNRTLFLDHLRLAMERARRNPGYLFCVLYMDLDRFKIINDSLGHSIGDELLKHVARQLEASVRAMDTVARFGGDEFAVLLEDFRHPREVVAIAKRILAAVRSPASLGGYDVHTSASIGIVLLTEHYTQADLILRDADTAMYHAKAAGKSRFKVFNRRMHEQAVRQLRLETDLARSVRDKDFTLLFQPMRDVATGALAGFEALVRWNHPERGLLAPAEFIHVAEDTGLIFPLGDWVLDQAGATIGAWEERFGPQAPVCVSVNLSAKQFMQPGLAARVEAVLRRTGIHPPNLCLETSESVLMDHASAAIDMLRQLKAHGVTLAMDDFGTGYSSLSYLRQFPIDALKIDRSFISRCDTDDEARVIVNSILTLAGNLGISAVAEGVDTQAQLETLRRLGCTLAQGYLFSRPLPRAEAEALLHQACGQG